MIKRVQICKALIDGEVLTTLDATKRWNVTDLPKEIKRGIERKFGVEISRVCIRTKLENGMPLSFVQYRLNPTTYNIAGIEKMRKYLSQYV